MDWSTEDELLQVLRRAIEGERQAQQLYALGASLASVPEVRDIFVRLIADEFEHEQQIHLRYQELWATISRRRGQSQI